MHDSIYKTVPEADGTIGLNLPDNTKGQYESDALVQVCAEC